MNRSPAEGGLHIAHVDIIHQLRTFDSTHDHINSFQYSLFFITVSWFKMRKNLKRGETCFCVKWQILMLQRHTPGSFYGCRYRIVLLNSHLKICKNTSHTVTKISRIVTPSFCRYLYIQVLISRKKTRSLVTQ